MYSTFEIVNTENFQNPWKAWIWNNQQYGNMLMRECLLQEMLTHRAYLRQIWLSLKTWAQSLFLLFSDTKLCAKHKKKNTCKYHLYCWDHVFKENEWCLVDYHKLRVSTQIMVRNCCLRKCRMFSACGRLSMAFGANFFVIQNIYINVNPTVKEGNQSFPYENHYKCYKKLTSRLRLVLFTLTHFFLIHTLLFSWKIKSCCDSCFPLQIRPKTTV